MFSKGNELLKSGDYISALRVYQEVGLEFGFKAVFSNVALCLLKLDTESRRTYIEHLKTRDFDLLRAVYAPNIIVSLTSYPDRINVVGETIDSILKQSFQPSTIILWLAHEQFPNKDKDLPSSLLKLKERGLEIKWTHDTKSYKKIIPTLERYKDKIIVTADDDIIYSRSWLLELLVFHVAYPKSIICHRAHNISLNLDGTLDSYNRWSRDIRTSTNSFSNFFTGCGGVLYPPGCLAEQATDEALFQRLCPSGDDIWLWAMAVLNNTTVKMVENSSFTLRHSEGSQENALWKSNVTGGHNDRMLENVFAFYPELKQKLLDSKVGERHVDVSVIVPIYNSGHYLSDCLESVLRQSYRDIEIICVDDGTTDPTTKAILDEYGKRDSRIKVISQVNSGPATARNNGIANANGTYIAFVDSDDFISENFVENLLISAVESRSDIAVADRVYCVDEMGKQTTKRTGFEGARETASKAMISEAIVTTGVSCNKLYRRSYLEKNKVSYLTGMRCFAEDNYFSTLALLSGNPKLSFCENAHYYYRQHGASITKTVSEQDFEQSVNLYNELKQRLIDSNIKDSVYWLNVVNKRAIKDLKWSAKTLPSADMSHININDIFRSHIDICCIADENYIVPTAVFLKSLVLTKSRDTDIAITILVPMGSKQKMIALEGLEEDDFKITLVEVDASRFVNLHKYKEEDNFCMASPSAMFKFIIPEIFSDLDRILYIDADLIVRKDLLELYMQPMEHEYLSAVIDMWAQITDREEVQNFSRYFNSGMMLMNLEKMRNDGISDQLIAAKMRSTNFNLMDQDVFNEVCGRSIKTLDIKYNFLPICYKRHKRKFKLDVFNKIYESQYESIEAVAADPVIVHWAGSEKPWKSRETLFADEWEEIYDSISHIVN